MNDLGSFEHRDGKDVLKFERLLMPAPERVWSALTSPGELVKWLGEVHVEPVVSGRFDIRWLNADKQGNYVISSGHVRQLDAPKALEFDSDVHGLIRWDLAPRGAGTQLHFTCTYDHLGDHRVSALAGWHSHLDFLGDWLDGKAVDWRNWPLDHWQEVHEKYSSREL